MTFTNKSLPLPCATKKTRFTHFSFFHFFQIGMTNEQFSALRDRLASIRRYL